MGYTFFQKQSDINKKWIVIDAENLVLGRLASRVAMILKGKHRPQYTPHMDGGDNVIIINAEKVAMTGSKKDRKDGKIYYRHTGFPGGIKSVTAGQLLEGKYPERVIKFAVFRMIDDSVLGKKIRKNLYVYKGAEHPHSAQKPEKYDFGSENKKNIRIG